MGPTHVENVAHLACRTALLRRGVAHTTFPIDLQDREIAHERSKRNIPGHTADVLAESVRVPDDRDLKDAAAILNQGKKVVILAGRGALSAGAELEQLADVLGAPVVKALLGKAVVPDDSAFTTGTYFEERDPVGPYLLDVPARRTRHLRLNDQREPAPAPIPVETAFSTVIESDVPVIVQYTRLDSRQAENALLSTIAFPQGGRENSWQPNTLVTTNHNVERVMDPRCLIASCC
jgi:hypothetical protein